MSRRLRVFVIVAGVALVAACSGVGSSANHTLTGHIAATSVVMNAADIGNGGHGRKGDSCTVESGVGEDDIRKGAPVVVKNDKGTLIATGQLGTGVLGGNWNRGTVRTFLGCTFPFSISGVPKASAYTVTVSHRGPHTYSYANLQAKNWDVELTLGSIRINPTGRL